MIASAVEALDKTSFSSLKGVASKIKPSVYADISQQIADEPATTEGTCVIARGALGTVATAEPTRTTGTSGTTGTNGATETTETTETTVAS